MLGTQAKYTPTEQQPELRFHCQYTLLWDKSSNEQDQDSVFHALHLFNPGADTGYLEKEMCMLLSKLGPKASVIHPVDVDELVPGTGSRSGQAGGWQGFWRDPVRLHT